MELPGGVRAAGAVIVKKHETLTVARHRLLRTPDEEVCEWGIEEIEAIKGINVIVRVSPKLSALICACPERS